MIWRLVWLGLIAAVAIITAQLQFDRQAARQPEFTEWVIAPFRSEAQAAVTANALREKDADHALVEARRLMQRRPIPSEHLTMLAVAHAKGGDNNTAAIAIDAASRRGWRDMIAQESKARLALADGDIAEAARRFNALMLLGSQNDALLIELADQIFADPASPGHEALVAVVSGTDRWHRLFLNRGQRVLPKEVFVRVIRESSERGIRFDCTALNRAGKAMARRDAAAGLMMDDILQAYC